ncbi:ubiquitin-protein ligase E3C-like [Mercenaria mercenaria]|uniref:ubiquitin-protein ligase E3C-like n=1 Tax=Mercenaria mercenaria TaxID=6596 RepID=UPI00234F9645|nr:ubiquitin-protein ligase E3C-like [Mercenaria mercenaria]
MYSFEGDFRRKPQQSLRGASKKEDKDTLLKNAQEQREKREEQRLMLENAIKIQSFYRGYRVRKKQREGLRQEFDAQQTMFQKAPPTVDALYSMVSKICHFYTDRKDGPRLVWLSQQLVKYKDSYLKLMSGNLKGPQQVKMLLLLCLSYLQSIANSGQPIAIPMRMLEVFTSQTVYKGNDVLKSVWKCLIDAGYFECMRMLLNKKVPSSLGRSHVAPTPVAASIYELVMNPISYAAICKDVQFSNLVLTSVCRSLLCPVYTEQISQFLLPAMAYGKYPFPFVDLIQTLITQCREAEMGEGKNKGFGRTCYRKKLKMEITPWLLGAFLTLGDKVIDTMPAESFSLYIQVLQRLLPTLPASQNLDDENSDSEEDMDFSESGTDEGRLCELREECLEVIDSQAHVLKMVALVSGEPDTHVMYAVSVICHCLMSQHRFSIHKRRLLYSLAYNQKFVRSLWHCCVTLSTVTATRTETALIMMLSRGLTMSDKDISKIVPVLATFCSMFSHSLHTLHDADFYGDNTGSGSSMPFNLLEVIQMVIALRDVCLGIIELAHPDAKPTINEDYRQALRRVGVKTRNNNDKELNKQTLQWGHLFKVTASLVRQIYTRDARRSFCPKDLWLSDRVKIHADGPSQIYQSNIAALTQRPFRTMQSLTKINEDEGGPPLSNRDVKNLVILTELPFVVSFHERVKILQKLISKDKEENQGMAHQFLSGPSINVMIRRNYIYEDAFDKLSPDNEENLKLKMRVQLVNAAGMDEAGIDGGGIFREFLNVLLKTGFDPNRGFFSQTTDRLLYPNPQAAVLTEDFRDHYYFLGRMLGKAIYENMLVELPFASFFLSKILSRHSGDLDIHHLASLDPEMYKNLLFLKHYDGDIKDLGLDFTTVNNDFGETKVVELKRDGHNIPVTAQNRIEYIHLMADYKLNQQIRKHCTAFREGMSDLINLEWLRMFDQQELQVLISGAAVPIDIEDLKQYTHYSGGYDAEHPVIKMFWQAVEELTDEQKRQLLKFITSCSRPPLLGFKDLYPALCVHYGGNEPDRLPTASTCMNLLKLPECKDYATLKHKLLYAIESGAGFELS